MYEVHLRSFPKKRREHIERIVHKHHRVLTHHEFEHVVSLVASGQPQVVARCHDLKEAENVVHEFEYHGAEADVEETEA